MQSVMDIYWHPIFCLCPHTHPYIMSTDECVGGTNGFSINWAQQLLHLRAQRLHPILNITHPTRSPQET